MNVEQGKFQPVGADELSFLGTDPVPARYYYDDEWFELERQAIFMRSWINVGHVCELPETGSFIRRDLEFAKASLLIVRGKDDQIRCFHNVCTHRGTQLTDAKEGKASKFSCPYHMWTFGSDGALLSAPEFDQFHVDKADCALKQVAIDISAGLIFINFAKDPPPLDEWLSGLGAEMETVPVAKATTFTEYVYEIDANWKLTYDNFQENYHLRFIHPRSGGAGIGEDNPYGYPSAYGFHGQHRTQTIWQNPAPDVKPFQAQAMGKGVASAMKRNLIGGPNDRQYFALFPSFFMIGTPIQNFSHVVYPLSATRSRGVIRIYWVGEDDNATERFAREYAMVTLRDIHSEDRSVINAGQRGLSSGALEHIHFQNQEALCRHLINNVCEQINSWQKEQS